MKIINLLTGEQNTGIFPHATTHHLGGTDPISAEAIGAEVAGVAANEMAAHLAEVNPHPQGNNSNTVPFTEDFDDFLSMFVSNKLGWSNSNVNGYFGSSGNNGGFSFAHGIFAIGVRGVNNAIGDYATLRLGGNTIRPTLGDGFSKINISAVVGLANVNQGSIGWASRFGLCDNHILHPSIYSIFISAEYWEGGYNWVAVWRRASGGTIFREIITPVTGLLNTDLFHLAIEIDCENYKIKFSVGTEMVEAVFTESEWTFGFMSPAFIVERNALDSNNTQGGNRSFFIDKYHYKLMTPSVN